MRIRNKERKSLPGWIVLLAVIGTIVGCFMLWSQEPTEIAEHGINREQHKETVNKPLTPTEKPQTEEKPLSPVEKLQYEVQRVLGSSNRGIARMYKIEYEDNSIQVGFTINDNLTNGWIKSGAKYDIAKILKAVQSSGYDYSEVIVIGTFSLTDKFGNSEESPVIRAKYTRNTINRINWQGFLPDNVYDIADSVSLHPTFE